MARGEIKLLIAYLAQHIRSDERYAAWLRSLTDNEYLVWMGTHMYKDNLVDHIDQVQKAEEVRRGIAQ